MRVFWIVVTCALVVCLHTAWAYDDEEDDSSASARGIIRRRRRRCRLHKRSVDEDEDRGRTLLFVVNKPYPGYYGDSGHPTNINYLGVGGGGGGYIPQHSPQGAQHHPLKPAPVYQNQECDEFGPILGSHGGHGGHGSHGGHGGGLGGLLGGGNYGGGGSQSSPQNDEFGPVGGGGGGGQGGFGQGFAGLGNGIGMSISSITNAITGAFSGISEGASGVGSRHGHHNALYRPNAYLRPVYRSIRQLYRLF